MSQNIRKLTTCALISAMYTVLCLSFAIISFTSLQIRISEAFTILAVFSPFGAITVTIACFFANLFGFLTGLSPVGGIDIVVGTAATGIAAFLSYKLRNIKFKGLPILSTIPPVIVNAVMIGGEITFLETSTFNPKIWLLNGTWVGIGQFISCVIGGLILYKVLDKTGLAKKYFDDLN